MEELADAIEDAQYVNAIASVEDGPRPVLPWEIPEEEELASWKVSVLSKHAKMKEKYQKKFILPPPFEFEWTLAQSLGFFLFSAYLKESMTDHVEVNFVEEVLRWKITSGRFRAEKTSYILANYLVPPPKSAAPSKPPDVDVVVEGDTSLSTEPAPEADPPTSPPMDDPPPLAVDGVIIQENRAENGDDSEAEVSEAPPKPKRHTPLLGPPKTEINQYDLARRPTNFTTEDIQELRAGNLDPTATCIGVGGTVLKTILACVDALTKTQGYDILSEVHNDNYEIEENGTAKERQLQCSKQRSFRNMSVVSNKLPETLFDEAEIMVIESMREKYWTSFQRSEQHEKLLNFLWVQDKTVVEEDFFVMRVLGRGGFGLVTACKKGTSGKLYAMKVMDKKRIKIKKAMNLTLSEQKCLANINSPFVVNLKYSFQSETDVFLILDLMTGGDLSYHLSQKGRFPKNECLFYAARIMLGLQALHDRGYVYRDLKPENCLMGDDGRVKLTDLGLATKITPNLRGAAGTRGYWAPEMLRRDKHGKRINYGHMVDWFSFGCCLAEFISGTNPFRSEVALNFGLGKEKKTKEKAIDCATLEMHPDLDSDKFTEDAANLCQRLLDKNEATRLGLNGCVEIQSHIWFRDVNWEEIIADRIRPPYIPPNDVNAASQSEIGTFAEDKKFHETVFSDKDNAVYDSWNFTNPKAFAAEVIEFLIYERETGEPLLPIPQNTSCCCTII